MQPAADGTPPPRPRRRAPGYARPPRRTPPSGRSRRRRWRHEHRSTSPLWEVFVRARRGLSHTHVGSLHAPDAELALRNARDLYTRRQEGVSIWVVPAGAITASSPDEKDAFFDPAADKVYRHPTFYEVPDGVAHL